MQTCVVCGWDTRSDTRVCLACRQSAEQRWSSTDDRSESEQLLSAVLQSTGGDRSAADDDRTSADAAVPESGPSARDPHRPPERTGAPDEQIMLRELDPAQQAAGTVDMTPPTRESSVAASLLQAFSDGADQTPSSEATASSTSGPPTPPDDDTARASAVTDELPVLDTPGDGAPGTVHGDADTERGDVAPDAGDADLPPDDEEPGAAHPDPVELHTTDERAIDEPEPDTTDERATDQPEPDTTDERATDEPEPDTTDERATDQPEPPATDDESTDPDHELSDDAGPPGVVDPDANAGSPPTDGGAGTGDDETPSSESREAPQTPETAAAPEAPDAPETADTAEVPARTETSDASETTDAPARPEASETSGDVEATHASETSEASGDGGSSAPVAPSPPDADDSATGPDTDSASDGQPPSTAPADAQSSADGARGDSGTERESLRSRLRTVFRELGAWTAVAQFALLVTGLLCVFQVVVLLVVLRFLLQSSTQDATTAANMLVAHGRAINGMLPALVAGALVVAMVAIWHARRARDRVPHGTRLFHVPMSLWAMIAAAVAVAAIVAVDTSSTVEQAAQTTLYAITACAVLGATAFIAPRSIAVAAPTSSESAARDHAGTSRDGHAPPRAETAPPAGTPATPQGGSEPPADANASADRHTAATTTPDDESRATDDITAPNTQAAQPQSDARPIPDRHEQVDASEASAA